MLTKVQVVVYFITAHTEIYITPHQPHHSVQQFNSVLL